jgi:hypothetical protein
MRIIALCFCAMAAGCSYTPVADLRASGDKAQVYQRDVTECKQLAKEVTFSWSLGYHGVVDKCLDGRGHSILNVQ